MVSSETLTCISASSAFYTLASSIDPHIPPAAASKMLTDFRDVVAQAVRNEIASDFKAALLEETDRDDDAVNLLYLLAGGTERTNPTAPITPEETP